MAITEDASSPATISSNSATTVTTASFSPPSGSLLVAMCAGNSTSAGLGSMTVSDSGSHTWTLWIRANSTPSGIGGGSAQIFYTYLSSAPGSITVTGTQSANTFNGTLLTVKVLDGASSTQTGATNKTSSTTAVAPTVSLTTTTTGSYVYGAMIDASNNDTLTANSNTTIITQDVDSTNGDTYASFKAASATGTPGATTFGFTAPSTCITNLVVAEILPAALGPADLVPSLFNRQQAVKRSSLW